MSDVEKISQEIRGRLNKLRLQGASEPELRAHIVDSMDATAYASFTLVASSVMSNPDHGVLFAHSIAESLSIVNNVLFFENGFAPITLHELSFMKTVIIKSIEEYTGADVFEALAKVDAHLKGGLN